MRAALEEKKRVEALQSAKRLRLQEVEALRSGFSDTSSDDGDAEQEVDRGCRGWKELDAVPVPVQGSWGNVEE